MSKTKTIAAITAGALAVIGLLFAIPNPAGAVEAAAPKPRKVTVVDYGSGVWGGPTSAVVRTGDPATADYVLIGDSIGNRCTPDIRTALLDKGKTLATITQSGQNTQGLVDLLLAESSITGKVVMEAGTNSVFTPPDMPAQIARVQNWTADNGLELFWGDTYVGRPATYVHDIRNSSWVNSYIYSAVPGDHVIKWMPALSAAVGRGRPLSYYLQEGGPGGGTHPWPAAGTTPWNHGDGCAFLAAVYVAGLGL